MGRKIPFWQVILVMIVMIALLYWSIVKDAGEKPHIALMIASTGSRYCCMFKRMEMVIS